MPRPQKNRMVNQPPLFSEFKPIGIPIHAISKINLSIDEYEAIRLADYLGMDQSEAANEMEISRPTFTRLIECARKKISDFIINGRHLTISGGNVHFHGNMFKCNECGSLFQSTIDNQIKKCPSCGSDKLIDMAGSFGHGRCCRKNKG